ncbi:MAG: DUF6089 family protein [Cytophagaceae bacterium]
MKKKLTYTLLAIACIFTFETGFAQKFNKKFRYTSVGVNVNSMNYVGDLDPNPSFLSPGLKYSRPNIGISLTQRLYPSLSLRGNVSYGRIQASDVNNANYNPQNIHRRIRNLSFRNDIFEIKFDAVWDLLENRNNYYRRVDYTPYLFTGIAYFYHNPHAKTPEAMGGQWVDLRPLQTEGTMYSLHQIAIPLGVGFRYKLNKNFDVAFEIAWRFTFTDYLDDVSDSYMGREYFGQNELAIAMQDRSMENLENDPYLSQWIRENNGFINDGEHTLVNGFGRKGDQRGQPSRKDWYVVAGFHLTYIIPPAIKCPLPKFR